MDEDSRSYRYPLRLVKDIRIGKTVLTDAKRCNREVFRNGRVGIFKPTLNVNKKTLKVADKRSTASEYGEFIACQIARKLDIPACDVELVKLELERPRAVPRKTVIVPGSISYLDLKPGEQLVHAINIMSRFRYEKPEENKAIVESTEKSKNNSRDFYKEEVANNCIDIIIPAFESYLKDKCNASEEKIAEVRQNLIEMTLFDCLFANRDRHDENYGLAIDQEGNVRFYPMFDNEYILGFSEEEAIVKRYSSEKLAEHIEKDLYSRMGILSNPHKITSASMFSHLFTHYPKESYKAYEKLKQFKTTDLVDIMDNCEGLNDFYKGYALKIFETRLKELKEARKDLTLAQHYTGEEVDLD